MVNEDHTFVARSWCRLDLACTPQGRDGGIELFGLNAEHFSDFLLCQPLFHKSSLLLMRLDRLSIGHFPPFCQYPRHTLTFSDIHGTMRREALFEQLSNGGR